jgi:hypothetical protein
VAGIVPLVVGGLGVATEGNGATGREPLSHRDPGPNGHGPGFADARHVSSTSSRGNYGGTGDEALMDVARRLARGLSNPQIAQELVISREPRQPMNVSYDTSPEGLLSPPAQDIAH